MSNIEFAEIIAYITAACGKSLPTASQVVYFDLLGDLPADAFRAAAKRVVLEHPWNTFPSVAELRQATAEQLRGDVQELAWPEAWEMAWRAIANMDPELEGSIERCLARLPKIVADAVNAMGVNNLCYGSEPVAVIRAQFRDTFVPIAARERRKALFTPAMIADLDKTKDRQALPASVKLAIEGIGRAV